MFAVILAKSKLCSLCGASKYRAHHRSTRSHHWYISTAMTAVSPSKSGRKAALPFNAETYKDRNVLERKFCYLTDYLRIATRDDRLARSFLAALCFVAARCYLIN